MSERVCESGGGGGAFLWKGVGGLLLRSSTVDQR